MEISRYAENLCETKTPVSKPRNLVGWESCYNNFDFQDGPVPCQGNSYRCCFCLKILSPIVNCFFKIRLGTLIALLYCPPPRNKIPGLPCCNPQTSPVQIPRPPLLIPRPPRPPFVKIPRPPLLNSPGLCSLC